MQKPYYGGLDEVGTGALAGNILTVVVILRMDWMEWPLEGIRDSKEMTAHQRKAIEAPLLRLLEEREAHVGVGEASVEEINTRGHSWSLMESYRRALREAVPGTERPKLLIVDGNSGVDGYAGPQKIEPKADAHYFPVAVASVLAKQLRDGIMDALAAKYPVYGWERGRGYGTREHVEAIRAHGTCPEHRNKAVESALRSFTKRGR
jgi:ribonuclease HII